MNAGEQYDYHPRELVYQLDKVKLYRYVPRQPSSAVPLLMVFATVNRPEILELFPDKSLIGGLLENNREIYLLDWGYPDAEDHALAFESYVTTYLARVVNHIRTERKLKQIDLLGVCQGGLLCLCYAALYQTIRRLILISTPVNFQTRDNVIAKLVKKLDVDEVAKTGNTIPGKWLALFFQSLRPFDVIKKLQRSGQQEKFARIEKWLQDSPDQPTKAFSAFLKDCYQENKLIHGDMVIKGKKINLKSVTIPVLNIMANDDRIVPKSASTPLKKYIGSREYTQKIIPGGHIGIYLSEKSVASLAKMISSWL